MKGEAMCILSPQAPLLSDNIHCPYEMLNEKVSQVKSRWNWYFCGNHPSDISLKYILHFSSYN